MLSTAQYYSVLLSITFFVYISDFKSKNRFGGIRSNPALYIFSKNGHTESSWAILSENPEQNPELAQYQNPKNEFESLGGW